MKICFICGEYPPASHGGIGSVTRLLGRALVAGGHEVRVIGVYRAPHDLPAREEDAGVRVWRLPIPPGKFGWTKARKLLFQNIRQWARRGEIDLVEVPDWEGYAAGWPRLEVPVVTRLHGSISYFAREMKEHFHWPAYCLEAASFHRADYCCSTSEYTARRTARLFGSWTRSARILYNPVEVSDEAAPSSRSSFRVVFAGTLTPKKGVVSLVQAWPRVMRSKPQAELHIFGKDAGDRDGTPMRERLAALLDPEHARSVHFYGHIDRERLRAEFRTCRLAVFPSFAEAFSMAPMEAMAEGCPVIYSERCSGPELIEHGVNGLLIDPANPGSIADSILLLLNDGSLCGRLGGAGRSSVAARFSSRVLVSRNEEFYRECVSRHV